MNTPQAEPQPQPDSAVIYASRSRFAIVRFLLIAVVILAGDLAIKRYVFADMFGQPFTPADVETFDEAGHSHRVLVPSVLNFKLTLNRGAVFGLGQGGRWVFILISIFATGVIGFVFARSAATARWLHIALAMVLGGAIGNMYDRLVFGAVRDMFWMFPEVKLPFGLHWPGGSDELYPWIYNLADVALCGGILLLFLVMYFGHSHDRPTESDQ